MHLRQKGRVRPHTSVPGPALCSVVGDRAAVEGQVATTVNRAPEGITCLLVCTAVLPEGDVA